MQFLFVGRAAGLAGFLLLQPISLQLPTAVDDMLSILSDSFFLHFPCISRPDLPLQSHPWRHILDGESGWQSFEIFQCEVLWTFDIEIGAEKVPIESDLFLHARRLEDLQQVIEADKNLLLSDIGAESLQVSWFTA